MSLTLGGRDILPGTVYVTDPGWKGYTPGYRLMSLTPGGRDILPGTVYVTDPGWKGYTHGYGVSH